MQESLPSQPLHALEGLVALRAVARPVSGLLQKPIAVGCMRLLGSFHRANSLTRLRLSSYTDPQQLSCVITQDLSFILLTEKGRFLDSAYTYRDHLWHIHLIRTKQDLVRPCRFSYLS
jgi:hypothetical protein